MNRYFSTGDPATDHNLSRLDHFASWPRFDGTREHVHDWLIGVLETVDMLPLSLRAHFNKGRFQTGSAHYDWSDQDRPLQWKRLANALESDLAKVVATYNTDGRSEGASIDMAGRPETRGERVEQLCEKLEKEGIDSAEGQRLLRAIEREAAFGIIIDVHALQRLAARKRKPDDYDYWVIRHITHMRMITGQMHHLC